jgi:hypothetical protein
MDKQDMDMRGKKHDDNDDVDDGQDGGGSDEGQVMRTQGLQ